MTSPIQTSPIQEGSLVPATPSTAARGLSLFPNDVIFRCLGWLSAQEALHSARFVCKLWNRGVESNCGNKIQTFLQAEGIFKLFIVDVIERPLTELQMGKEYIRRMQQKHDSDCFSAIHRITSWNTADYFVAEYDAHRLTLGYREDPLEYFNALPSKIRHDRKVLVALYSKWKDFSFRKDMIENWKDIVPTKLQNKRRFALEIVTVEGRLLEMFEEIRDDEEIVLRAVENHGEAFSFASERLQNCRKIALAALTHDRGKQCFLRKLPEIFRDDYDLVALALKQSGCQLRFASDRLKQKQEIALIAVGQDITYGLEDVPNELKGDRKFILAVIDQYIKKHGYGREELVTALRQFVPADLMQDQEIFSALQSTNSALNAIRLGQSHEQVNI
jgi:hypothetical protein